ncbi:MAG: sigma 54-interacting transcriptional regulator [Deltaproteobacteria bacterium]|jgi:Nif-specific regulatory protein|nr:sigma 54-interacting transcriptional regulator [Deltaproteobacteria bacterium]
MDRKIFHLNPPPLPVQQDLDLVNIDRPDADWTGLVPLLVKVGRLLSERDGLNPALDCLLAHMRQHMGSLRAMVCLCHEATEKIFVHRSIGLTAEERNRGVYGFGEGVTGRAARTGRPVVVSRIGDEPLFLNRTRDITIKGDLDRSFVCVPIVRSGKVLGCLSSEGRFGGPPRLNRHVDALTVMADLLAGPLELYLTEKIDKVLWERRAQSLVTELGEMRRKYCPTELVGSSKAMQDVYFLIRKVAAKKTTVLLFGESGVGKEMVANAIHYDGLKAVGPLIKFNCAGLTELAAESQLFGHQKGPFTETVFHKGRFEAADGGTIFLDEIGQLPLGVQAKLLRVLQEHTFERVGGAVAVKVDIRVVAATTRDLSEMVAKGLFREDLYYRLNVFPIFIPPLRERDDDVVTLARHFLTRFARETQKKVESISSQALKLLRAYDWPGNVRELENVMLRAVILAEDKVIQPHDLPLSLKTQSQGGRKSPHGLETRLANIEHEMLTEALRHRRGNISAAAKDLGLTRRSMGLRMKRLNLTYKQFRPIQGPAVE